MRVTVSAMQMPRARHRGPRSGPECHTHTDPPSPGPPSPNCALRTAYAPRTPNEAGSKGRSTTFHDCTLPPNEAIHKTATRIRHVTSPQNAQKKSLLVVSPGSTATHARACSRPPSASVCILAQSRPPAHPQSQHQRQRASPTHQLYLANRHADSHFSPRIRVARFQCHPPARRCCTATCAPPPRRVDTSVCVQVRRPLT